MNLIVYKNMRSIFAYGAGFKRKQIFQRILLIAIVLIIFSLLPAVFVKLRGQNRDERRNLRDFFESENYELAYNQSKEMLEERPLDFLILTINGFSAYQLAIAQINNFNTLSYINECIWSLRKALLLQESSSDGRISYVLGKAYFYKGPGYADLAVHYLEKAMALSYRAADIPEYLGLSYAALRDYRSSVAAFSLALNTGEEEADGFFETEASDLLLLSIAKSYIALEEYDSGHAYLIRCIETSRDSKTIGAARILLGGLLIKKGDLRGAEAEYLSIIADNGENAEAHFLLGELFALEGDTTRARAEWRRAIRIDPVYVPARSRLNMQ